MIELCSKPIFVVGAPRSGTTILAVALSKHSRLWTSGESYIPWELFGSPRGRASLDQLMQTSEVLGQGSWLTAQKIERGELLAYLGRGINALYSSRAHGRRWIDHTPVQTLMIDLLGEMFPDALFLHALRDGREVVNSMIHFLNALEPEVKANFDKAGWKIPWLDFTEACRTWRQYTEAATTFAERHPERLLTVRHDRLVSDPENCCREIFRFVDVPDENTVAQFIRSERLHPSFPKPGQSRRPSPWQDWSASQKATFLHEAAPTLLRHGFAVRGELILDEFEMLVHRVRETAESILPTGTTVAVASHGDDEFLQLGSRTARHIPASSDGAFLGGSPADSADALQHLERAQRAGARYFLLPSPQFWWRDHYADFQAHLNATHRRVWDGDDCTIYELLERRFGTATTRDGMLSRLQWEPDYLKLDDLVFWIQRTNKDVCPLGDSCFRFYKGKGLVDLYAKFWATRAHVPVGNLLELGIWDGGSSAFWFEFFQPRKHVAMDWMKRQDSEYFNHYRRSRGIESRLRTYWGVDQGDAQRLTSMVSAEFAEPLDLVIDDASHLLGPTKTSFETLFPRLRPGGYYIIEDWAWEHWPEFHTAGHVWEKEKGLKELLDDLTAALGTRGGLIAELTINHGFVAIERGPKALPLDGFRLEDHIVRRPPPPRNETSAIATNGATKEPAKPASALS